MCALHLKTSPKAVTRIWRVGAGGGGAGVGDGGGRESTFFSKI